ncbi:hypothetical protein BD410DRAFT_801855 [Rickenella mellea]|uniref:DUF6533 domain-containing protein n=1 Tax=Rickenella mellea TaxID=50990 RepID=A0A4Y7QA10_9AGAM|nr:hypothetical protein BD410DRAFT_801855 [Rickenella mellea]
MQLNFENLGIESNVNHYYSIAAFGTKSSLNRCIHLNVRCSEVFLYYDYFLTLGDEVEYFWGKRVRMASGLFFAGRYVCVIGYIPIILQVFVYWSPNMIVGFILITRTHALYERARWVLVLMVFSAMTVIAVAGWSITGGASTMFTESPLPNAYGCNPTVESDAGRRLAVAWGCCVVFDTEIVILTLFRTVKLWKMGVRRLVHVLLRDGCICYVALTLANLSQILTFLPPLKGVGTTFVNVLSIVVITRMMINMRDPRTFESTGYLDTIGPFKVKEITQTVTKETVTTLHNLSSLPFTPVAESSWSLGCDVENGLSSTRTLK